MLNQLPAWLSVYWVGVTVVRLVISVVVIYIFGRRVSLKKPSARTAGIWIVSAGLTVWVALTIYLGRGNVFRIDMDTTLPPPIAAAALIPILVGYLAFQYVVIHRVYGLHPYPPRPYPGSSRMDDAQLCLDLRRCDLTNLYQDVFWAGYGVTRFPRRECLALLGSQPDLRRVVNSAGTHLPWRG